MNPDDNHDVSESVESDALRQLTPEQRERLTTILDRYLVSLEQGEPLAPESLARDNPDLADALRSYLRSLDDLHNVAAGFGGNLASSAVTDVSRDAGNARDADQNWRSDLTGEPASSTSAAPEPITSFPSPLAIPAREAEHADERRIGDFRLIRTLGQGGMGVVYEALQISLGRRVALKVLPFAAVLDQRQITRFKNEAQAAAQLNHPHIVPVYAIGVERGVHYYAMQFIDGQSLDRAIAELRGRHPLEPSVDGRPAPDAVDTIIEDYAGAVTKASPGDAGSQLPRQSATCRELSAVLRLGIDAAEALHAAHESGVIHRDIKPSNLMLDAQGKIWITDFGLARVRGDQALTKTGDVVGTQRYMSPEQAAGQTALVDPRSDVYSLAVTLYELLTLQPAYVAGREKPVALRRLRRDVPLDFETVLNKAMSVPRDERYPTAQAFADDLRRVLEGKPAAARPPTLRERLSKWSRQHRRVVVGAVSLSLLVSLGLAVATVLVARARRQSEANFVRAERNYRDAREIVDRLGAQVAERLADVPGADDARRDVLRDTLHYYGRFAEQTRDDPQWRVELAATYAKMGMLADQLGELDESLAHFEHARRTWRQLVDDSPTVADYQRQLALCLYDYGRALYRAGRLLDAHSRLDAAIGLQQRLVQRHAEADSYSADLASSQLAQGVVLADQGELDAAERTLRKATAIFESLHRREPTDVRRRQAYALSLDQWASALSRQGRHAKTADVYRQSVRLREELLRDEPEQETHRRDLATLENNLGLALHRQHAVDEAERSFHRSLELLQDLVERFPNDPSLHSSWGAVWNNLGNLAEERGDLEAAGDAFDAAAKQQRIASDLAPDVERFRHFLSRHLENLTRVKRKLSEFREPGSATQREPSSSVSSVSSVSSRNVFSSVMPCPYLLALDVLVV